MCFPRAFRSLGYFYIVRPPPDYLVMSCIIRHQSTNHIDLSMNDEWFSSFFGNLQTHRHEVDTVNRSIFGVGNYIQSIELQWEISSTHPLRMMSIQKQRAIDASIKFRIATMKNDLFGHWRAAPRSIPVSRLLGTPLSLLPLALTRISMEGMIVRMLVLRRTSIFSFNGRHNPIPVLFICNHRLVIDNTKRNRYYIRSTLIEMTTRNETRGCRISVVLDIWRQTPGKYSHLSIHPKLR